MGQKRYKDGFKLTVQPEALELPLKWRKGKVVFVNSMSDLFHKDVPDSYIKDVFDVMKRADQHVFQVLTKRSERLRDLAPELPWPDHIWMGVSVEDRERTKRIEHLVQVDAKVRFLSIEPMLEALPNLNLNGIHWVIVGGESGRTPRPIEADWVRDIREQCKTAKVKFFFKQWGGTNKKKAGRTLDGKVWNDMPLKKRQPSLV